jgi:hypothetical protein
MKKAPKFIWIANPLIEHDAILTAKGSYFKLMANAGQRERL